MRRMREGRLGGSLGQVQANYPPKETPTAMSGAWEYRFLMWPTTASRSSVLLAQKVLWV